MHSETEQLESANQWKILLFGALELERPDGSKVRFGGKVAGALLAHLALSPERAQTREKLAELIWPESDSVNGRTRLRQEIAALRAYLQQENLPAPLDISRTEIRLRSELVWTDAARFRAALQEAHRQVDTARREELLATAVGFCRADLLTEYQEFTAERLEFARCFEQACRELASLALQRGDARCAEETLLRLLARDPLLEEAHQDLMRLYAATQQPSKIRRQYEELERALRDLSVKPTSATRALLTTLLQSVSEIPPLELPLETPAPVAANLDSGFAPGLASSRNGKMPPPAGIVPSPTTPPDGTAAAAPQEVIHPSRTVAPVARYLVLVCLIVLPMCWRYLHSRTAQPQQPAVRYGSERWTYTYAFRPGEKPNSEAKALAQGENGELYVTGLIDTETEDADILTVKLSQDGKQVWTARYSGEGHDCERAFSCAPDGSGGVFVAGETYLPAAPGRQEGWRIVLLRYNADGHLDARGNARPVWIRTFRCELPNPEQRIRVCGDGQGGAYVGGTALINGATKMALIHYNSIGRQTFQTLFPQDSGKPATFNDMMLLPEGLFACGTVRHAIRADGAHDNVVTLCVTSDGKLRWHNLRGGPTDNSTACAITPGPNGTLYVGAAFHLGDPAAGGAGIVPAITRYTIDGTPLWTRYYPQLGPAFQFKSMAAGPQGSYVTVAGYVSTISGDIRAALVRYDQYGNFQWTQRCLAADHRSCIVTANVDPRIDYGCSVGAISDQPQASFHSNNQMFITCYEATGKILSQRVFQPFSGGNNPLNALLWQPDGSLILAGQCTLAENQHLFTVINFKP